jgi:hypothetical protein
MWSGGISNPLSVIEQLTYLLFIRGLDELHTLWESKAARTGRPIEQPIFTPEQDRLRWSRNKETVPETMFETVRDEVFANVPLADGARHLGGFIDPLRMSTHPGRVQFLDATIVHLPYLREDSLHYLGYTRGQGTDASHPSSYPAKPCRRTRVRISQDEVLNAEVT